MTHGVSNRNFALHSTLYIWYILDLTGRRLLIYDPLTIHLTQLYILSTQLWSTSSPGISLYLLTVFLLQRLDIDLGVGDIVEIYDGEKPTDPRLAKYTGDGSNGPRHVMTTGDAAYVYMDTTLSKAGRGFQFSYITGWSTTLLNFAMFGLE